MFCAPIKSWHAFYGLERQYRIYKQVLNEKTAFLLDDFPFSVTLRLSKLTEKDYDENLIYLLGQYLPQSDGGVRDEGLGRLSGAAV